MSARAEVRRHGERAAYDAESLHSVLDGAPVAHVGFAVDGQPFVIPMVFGRIGDRLYLHGSVASRLQRGLAQGLDVCLTVTHVDGLVLAKSAFHHSVNYRSAVVFGRATRIEGEEAMAGLHAITDHLRPGRWAEVREPNDLELRQTSILRLDVTDASVKCRTGPPIEDPADLDLPAWTGVVPSALAWGDPVPAEVAVA